MSLFDLPVERKGTSCVKWDGLRGMFKTDDVLPMWVADMDFKVPEAVTAALQERIGHGVFGYTLMSEGYKEAVKGWMQKRHGWAISSDSIVYSPGVVPALHQIVQAFTEPGDQVIIQPPVYPPFSKVVLNQGRELVLNPLRETDGDYMMDFDHLESLMNEKVKMLILCNPHNPIGRVWNRGELEQLQAIAEKYDVLIVSDEIHADLVFAPNAHVPYATLSAAAADRSIICTAPSKTFNLAALHTSNIIVSNAALREKLEETLRSNMIGGIGALGMAATEAAYNHGEEWLNECLAYIKGNMEYVQAHLSTYKSADGVPLVTSKLPEATYLMWLDFRRLGLEAKELEKFIIEQARLGLNTGASFGKEGEGYMRINLACTRSTVEEAMARLDAAMAGLLRG